jgi:hypothetical protein
VACCIASADRKIWQWDSGALFCVAYGVRYCGNGECYGGLADGLLERWRGSSTYLYEQLLENDASVIRVMLLLLLSAIQARSFVRCCSLVSRTVLRRLTIKRWVRLRVVRHLVPYGGDCGDVQGPSPYTRTKLALAFAIAKTAICCSGFVEGLVWLRSIIKD